MGLSQMLTVQEVAELLKTSIHQVRKMAAEGTLPAMKIGREWRIPAKFLEAFLEEAMR